MNIIKACSIYNNHINLLIKSKQVDLQIMKRKISFHRTEQFLQSPKVIEKVTEVKNKIEKELCSDLPNTIWDKKKHIVDLPCMKTRPYHFM